MKKILLTFMVFMSASALGYGQEQSDPIPAPLTVSKVIDCATLELSDGQTVSLIGIQAPGNLEQGKEATGFVKSLGIEGRKVCLSFDVQKRDKYGRLLAYVTLGEGYWNNDMKSIVWVGDYQCEQAKAAMTIFLNRLIIEQGYAQVMTPPAEATGQAIPPNVKYQDLFVKLEKEAQEQKRGLWRSRSLQLSADIALLRSFDQKGVNASPQVMEAARRVFATTEFVGLSKQQVADMLGNPARDEGASWFYSFHNGEMGYQRRFHFDASGHVTKVDILPTQ